MTSLMKRSNGHGNMPATSFSGLVDKIFHENVSRFFDDDFWSFSGVEHAVNVPANIRETGISYEMDLAAPGLRKEDFKVNVNGDMLTISVEKKEENNQQQEDEGWLHKEYSLQSFSRSFNIDDTVDADRITARYSDGILHLTLPKKEGAQRITRNIEIR